MGGPPVGGGVVPAGPPPPPTNTNSFIPSPGTMTGEKSTKSTAGGAAKAMSTGPGASGASDSAIGRIAGGGTLGTKGGLVLAIARRGFALGLARAAGVTRCPLIYSATRLSPGERPWISADASAQTAAPAVRTPLCKVLAGAAIAKASTAAPSLNLPG